MKPLLIFILLGSAARCDVSLAEQSPKPSLLDQGANPRSLRIKVEELPPSSSKEDYSVDPQKAFLKQLDDVIDEYGLEKNLNPRKLKVYFKDLENQVFRKLKKSLDKKPRYKKIQTQFEAKLKELDEEIKYSL